jgi:eukaryotic-like serine/threonine-protein kinase
MDSPPSEASSGWDRILEQLRSATAGEFRVIRRIGCGGMAAVFLAHEVALNRMVAIKVMAPALLLADGMLERFRHEAISVAKMTHPNIVTIHAVRHLGDLHFFVMQLVEGRPLDYLLEHHGRLSVELVRSISFQVGSALAYAHRRGVIHRDVKPANLLIDHEGNAIVTDFGIAKVMEAPGYTQTGLAIGTPTYMSPEQYAAGELSWSSDQYSLGVVVYEMLTGAPPFTGSGPAIMQGHLQRPAPPLRALRPDCPAALEAAVLRMLEKEPALRWPSMAEALRALGAFLPPEGDPVREELARLATPDPRLAHDPQDDTHPSPTPARQAGAGVSTIPASGAATGTASLDEIATSAPAEPTGGTAPQHTPEALPGAALDASLLFRAPGWQAAGAAARPASPAAASPSAESTAPADASAPPAAPPLAAASGIAQRREAGPGDTHRRRRLLLGAAAVTGVATLGTLAWLILPGSGAPDAAPAAAGPGEVLVPPAAHALAADRGSAPAADSPGAAQPAAPQERPGEDPRTPSAPSATAPAPSPTAAPSPDAGAAPRPTWTPAGVEADVHAVLDSFVKALATGNAQSTRRLYDGLRGEEPWWHFVSSRAASELRVAYFALQSSPIITGENSVQADFEVTFGYREGAESLQQWYLLRARLTHDGGRWRITEIRYF